MKSKGQTAIEYLLMVVVVVAMITVLMVWSQGQAEEVEGATSEKTDVLLCELRGCDDQADCLAAPCPTDPAEVDCELAIRRCKIIT